MKKRSVQGYKDRLRMIIPDVIFVLVLLFSDQFTKQLAVDRLMGAGVVSLIPGVMELIYVENTGMAFGLLKGGRIIFLVICMVFLPFLWWFHSIIPAGKRFLPLRICLILITAGALGNAMDRLLRGYVVDFFQTAFIDFPVFNLADCYVVVGAFLLVFMMLFVYKEGELHE